MVIETKILFADWRSKRPLVKSLENNVGDHIKSLHFSLL
jgi:hypothetical protein